MNLEKLVANYLRTTDGLRVVAKTPNDTDEAWVRVRLLVSRQPDNLPFYRFREAYVQVDCYASVDNGQPEASQMAEAVSLALSEMDQAEHEEGEVTACRIENGGMHEPDTNFNPARERFIVTASIWAHPLDEAAS